MKKILFIVTGLITIAIFPSCLTKKYHAPQVDAEGLFRDENPTDTNTIADISWDNYFSDTILVQLIEEGLSNNFDLQIAYTSITQAEASLRMAQRAYFPNVSLAGSVNYLSNSIGDKGKKVFGYNSAQYSLGVTASWEADIWGKIRRQSKAQYAQFLYSQAYFDLIKTSLIANIATSYYSLLALDEQLKITFETINSLKESTETMQALMEAGMLTGASVEQSKALYYATQVTIPDLESQIRQMENSLCVLLGRKPQSISRSSLDEQQVDTLLHYGVPVQMLARRPDVWESELSFRSAFELTQAAKAAFYPSITLNTGSIAGLLSTTLSSFFTPENIFANVLGGITQPLFAQGKLRGNLKIAEAEQESALLNFRKTVLSASQEVSDILFGFESSLSKNSIRQKQIEALNTSVYFTQELLKAGEANYTEVLTAQQNLLSAQLSQVSDKLEQLQYSVNLYRALGGGVE
ncbi:MAG: efflux transporter outer membrane subunit [Prevotellaceae bacterium]|jgi:NodT family efflux transporter outer membrane factor (OMF) lipoprotein|nr:efflux transporter outer membrane subunit [Prevotellaceae bacterium]